MKKALNLLALLATAALAFTACNKDREDVVATHERDITYTVAEKTTTVHLKTDAEWEELLDRFCDYAESGSTVTFWNQKGAKTGSLRTKDAATYSTTDREAMKRWMREQEDAGKTVTITYDSGTGTWRGEAYANAPEADIVSQWDFVQCHRSYDFPDEDSLRESILEYALFRDLTFYNNGTLQIYLVTMETVYPPTYAPGIFAYYLSDNQSVMWLENETIGLTYQWQIIEFTDSSFVFGYQDSIGSDNGIINIQDIYTYRRR